MFSYDLCMQNVAAPILLLLFFFFVSAIACFLMRRRCMSGMNMESEFVLRSVGIFLFDLI